MVDSQIVIFFGQDCCCSRDMKYYYLCFKKEALIVQETFLNWYVIMFPKDISILCHSTLHPVNIHIKRPNDRKTQARCKSGRSGQRGSGHKA